ncbi:MAG: multicopper oxidase domain-containing protein [Acidimicrobiia bacterium]
MDKQESSAFGVFGALAGAFALVIAAIAILASNGNSSDSASGSGGSSAPTAVEVVLKEFSITPSTLTVAQGGMIHVTNQGSTEHNLKIRNTSLGTTNLVTGATGMIDLGSLAPGDYEIFCEVAGHEAAGMTGTLKVSAGTGTAVAAGGAPTTAKSMTAEEMDAMMKARTAAFPAKTAGVGALPMEPKVGADGVKEFDLTAKIVDWEVEPGKIVKAWAYNGMVPGPTLKVNTNDKVRVVLKNELPESTIVHFHGINLPNAMDGVPDITQEPIKPGATFAYEFTAPSEPTVAMYHSHHNGQVQVPNGLLGGFLVGEMPLPSFVPKLASSNVMVLNDAGTVGLTLNGKSFPATAPLTANLGEWIRVDYMNEGLMEHPMHLHGPPQLVIAVDGHPLPQPYWVDTVPVSPGQRITVVIKADNPGVWAYHCHILTHAEGPQGMFGMVTAMIITDPNAKK